MTDTRKGYASLASQAGKVLKLDPFAGLVFSSRRGDLIKVIWWDSQGAYLLSKRLERGKFVSPATKDGKVSLTPAQMAMLLEAIDWRMPGRTWRPLRTG